MLPMYAVWHTFIVFVDLVTAINHNSKNHFLIWKNLIFFTGKRPIWHHMMKWVSWIIVLLNLSSDKVIQNKYLRQWFISTFPALFFECFLEFHNVLFGKLIVQENYKLLLHFQTKNNLLKPAAGYWTVLFLLAYQANLHQCCHLVVWLGHDTLVNRFKSCVNFKSIWLLSCSHYFPLSALCTHCVTFMYSLS